MKTGIKSTQKNRRQRAPTANRPNQFRDRKTNPKASPMSIRGGGATEVLTDPPNVLILPRLCTLGIPACRAIGEHYVCPSTTWRQFGRAPPRPAWGEPRSWAWAASTSQVRGWQPAHKHTFGLPFWRRAWAGHLPNRQLDRGPNSADSYRPLIVRAKRIR